MRILLAAITMLAVAAQASAETFRVGSKIITEQFIVAELYAAALEQAGRSIRSDRAGPCRGW